MSNLRYAHSEGHTDLCYSGDSQYIITCGCEGDVRLWKGIDDSDQTDLCAGERAWSIAQKGKSLYVGIDTNVIQAYTFPALEPDGIMTRFTAPVTHIDVSRDGKKLAAGSCDMTINIIDIQTLECIKIDGHKAPILSICLDPKNNYLASSSSDGTVKIWSIENKEEIKKWDCLDKSNSFDSAKSLCRIHFDKDGRLLAIPSKSCVKLYERETWSETQVFTDSSVKEFSIAKFSPCGQLLAIGSTDGHIQIWNIRNEKLIQSSKDDNYSITAIAWKGDSTEIVYCNKNGQLGSNKIQNINQNDDDDLANIPMGIPDFDDDDDDDENVISLEKIKSQTEYKSQFNDDASDSDSSVKASAVTEKYIQKVLPISELQQPFQPSSTPTHLQQRFMVWNDVGIVRQFDTEGVNEVDVEFHDTSENYGMRLNNIIGHTMATLTSKVVVLACPKIDDAPSKLCCMVLKSWDGQKEWDVTMSDEEEILGVGAGDDWVCIATDASLLRLFTLDGSQTDIYSIPGKFVSLNGRGNKLSVAFHTGLGMDGDQYLSYAELCVNTFKLFSVITIKPLPLTSGSSLRWYGFTDEGSLASFDSKGILRVLYGNNWRPICALDDHCKSKFDHYFVIGINELSHNIRCILCKGAYYPPVIPKPLVAEIKWQIPLCEMNCEKSKLEDEYLRQRITLPNIEQEISSDVKQSIDKSISISVMKLFALACQSGLEARAITLCDAMSVDVLKLAAKYAAKIGRQQLAEKVNDIASRKTEAYEEETIKEQINQRSISPILETVDYSQDLFEDEPAKENLISKMQKNRNTLSPKPIKIKRLGNPFKKDIPKSLTDDGMGKSSFMDWYSENRERLQDEFPLLKEAELARAGMKQYNRHEMNTLFSQDSESTIVETEIKKRKASPGENSTKKKQSLSKLKMFTFNKT